MSEKLDPLSKIIIATGQINFMSAHIHVANSQIRLIPDQYGFQKDGLDERNSLLNEVVENLGDIMEKLGNLINSYDMATPIDERVSEVPFDIVVHGNDDIEGDI